MTYSEGDRVLVPIDACNRGPGSDPVEWVEGVVEHSTGRTLTVATVYGRAFCETDQVRPRLVPVRGVA